MTDKKQRKRNKGRHRLIKFFLSLTGFFIFLVLIFIFLIYFGFFGPIPEQEELAGIKNEEATLVFSSDNKLIGKVFASNRTSIPFEKIPDHLIDALISTEDIRFYEHNGIDGRSLLRVMVKSILMGNRASGGGSTITQQLAKNLYGRKDFGFLTLPVAKIRESILAMRLEEVYSKNEILLFYLNSVPFGEEVYGIEAAANRYFNKSVSGLKTEESALLVGMLKANTYFNPRLHSERALERRNLVLELMKNNNKLTGLEAENLKSKPLTLDYANFRYEGPAQYFLYQVEQKSRNILKKIKKQNGQPYVIEKDGLKIVTTLDSRLQELSRMAIREHLKVMQVHFDKDPLVRNSKTQLLNRFENNDKKLREIWTWDGIKIYSMTELDSAWHYNKMLHSGMLIMEPRTGKIRVWIGGNYYRYLPYDLVLAERMIASAFKPLIYTAALEEGYDPCDYFDNEIKVYEKYENWTPANYDGTSGDEVSMWYALSRSLNLPTVDLYFKTGHNHVEDFCFRMGIEDLPDNAPSISLGALDLSLMDMVPVYGTFANNGSRIEPCIIQEIRDSDGKVIYEKEASRPWEVMDQKNAHLINAMLRKAVNEGTGIRLGSQFGLTSDLAGKTGTSQDYSDAWFFTYNPDLVCGIWVGARDPQVHFSTGKYGNGSALALPIAGELISKIEKDGQLKARYLSSFSIPAGYTNELDCEGMRTKGAINRLIENIFGKDDEKPENGPENIETKKKSDTVEKEDSGIKKFFKRLFGKKK